MNKIIATATLIFAIASFAQTTEYPHVQDNGGGYVETPSYRSYASIGQPVIGECGDGSYTNQAGYITGLSVYLEVKDEPGSMGTIPEKAIIGLPYPNPFNSTCRMEIVLPRESDIVFSVFDLMGQRIFKQTDHSSAGAYRLTFDAGALPSGIYLYRVSADHAITDGRLILVK